MGRRNNLYAPTRARNTPEYNLWRVAVFKRDKFTCKKCGQKPPRKSKRLQAHHILSWANYPALRYDINNGITLCWNCHKEMFHNENGYVELCKTLIGKKDMVAQVQKMIYEDKQNEQQQSD